MSGRCYTGHARERAFERYGLRLTDSDFVTILADCVSGRAPCMRKDENGRTHIAKYLGHHLIVTMPADKDLIVTFQPPDFFRAGSGLAHRNKRNHGKQRQSAHHFACNPEYRRAQWKREAQLSEDDS